MPNQLTLSDHSFVSKEKQVLLEVMPQFIALLSRAIKESLPPHQNIDKISLLNTWSASRKNGVWTLQGSASSKIRRFSNIVRAGGPSLFDDSSSYLSGQFTQDGLSNDLVFSMMDIAKNGKYPDLLQQGGVLLKCFVLLAQIIVSETVLHKTPLIASPLGLFWFGNKREREAPFSFDLNGYLQWSPQFDLDKIKTV